MAKRKTTIRSLQNCRDVFKALTEQEIDKSIAWSIFSLIEEVDAKTTLFQKVIKKIQEKYMVKAVDPSNPDNKDYYEIPKEKVNDYIAEYDSLLNQEVEIDTQGLTLDSFKTFEKISVKDIILLNVAFFKEPELVEGSVAESTPAPTNTAEVSNTSPTNSSEPASEPETEPKFTIV